MCGAVKMAFEPISASLIICLVAGLYSGILKYVMYELGGMKKVMEDNKRVQKEMRDVNKKYMDAARARRDSELKKYEQKMNEMAFGMLKSQLKPMLFMLPILFVSGFIVGELNNNFSDFSITLPVDVPVPQLNFENFINWRDTFGPVGWFWITFMLVSIAAQVKSGIGVKKS